LGLTSTDDRCGGKVSFIASSRIMQYKDTMLEEKHTGIFRAAAQYGVEQRIVDLCTFDVTRSPWRRGSFFDAIITDPPCEHHFLNPDDFYRPLHSQMG